MNGEALRSIVQLVKSISPHWPSESHVLPINTPDRRLGWNSEHLSRATSPALCVLQNNPSEKLSWQTVKNKMMINESDWINFGIYVQGICICIREFISTTKQHLEAPDVYSVNWLKRYGYSMKSNTWKFVKSQPHLMHVCMCTQWQHVYALAKYLAIDYIYIGMYTGPDWRLP